MVIGATASGKSALAMEIARQVGGEILCADSMTVYRGMDIGTAKATPAERAQVPHHLVDIAEPNESFTVARFVERADEVIKGAKGRHVPIIVTGGTPLYYKALFEGLFDGPEADQELRERLLAQGKEKMYERLRELDPAAVERIHLNDTRRIVRALEVYELTGKPISDWQKEWASGERRHPARFVGLDWDKDLLNRRINARVKGMMQAGWLDEVRGLLQRYGELSRTASEATGYAELIAHLGGEMTLDDAVERTKIATRQLARRQLKWFRRFNDVHWIKGDRPVLELAAQAMNVFADA